jgi:hypothetical protein
VRMSVGEMIHHAAISRAIEFASTGHSGIYAVRLSSSRSVQPT